MSRLYLSNPCALFPFLHTLLRAQSAPGFPCASLIERSDEIAATRAKNTPRESFLLFEN